MAARRMRAAILQMIPGDVTHAAVDRCRMTIESGLSARMNDPKERTRIVTHTVRAFEKSFGATQKDLEGYLGAIEKNWTADHMLRLRELKNSLEDGAVSIGDVFKHLASENQNSTITKEQAENLLKMMSETGKQGDISAALKKMGIAKVADTPASRHDEVLNMILDYSASDAEPEEQAKTEA
jgi:hypothetical protein